MTRTAISISKETKQVLEALRNDFLKVKGMKFKNFDDFLRDMCIFTKLNFIDVDEIDEE